MYVRTVLLLCVNDPTIVLTRAHRLSGHDPEEDDDDSDDEEREFLELKKKNPDELSSFDRAKLKVENIVEKMGFFGILACASVSVVALLKFLYTI